MSLTKLMKTGKKFLSKPSLDKILNKLNKESLKAEFKEYYDGYADDDGLDYEQCIACLDCAASNMAGFRVTKADFDQANFQRFDFDADGQLDCNEARRALEALMRQYQQDSGQTPPADVPFQTPEQAGYTVVKILASGGQGSTALAKGPKGDIALKIYDKNNANAGGIESLRAEWETMKRLRNDNCMRCSGIFQDSLNFYCVNELLPGGDLASLRKNCDAAGVDMDEDYFVDIFSQCINGLSYMHKRALMHCDIKEPNIMLKTNDMANPKVCLIDFGMASTSSGNGLAGGTPGYVPPETVGCFFGEPTAWYPRGDVFSMGVVFYQLINDMTPDEKTMKAGLFSYGCQSIDQVAQVTKTRQPDWMFTYNNYPSIYEFLLDMLSKDRYARPTSVTLSETPPLAKSKGLACNIQ